MSHDPKYNEPDLVLHLCLDCGSTLPLELVQWDIDYCYDCAGIPAAEPCNECGRDVPESDAGPSCGAHVLHIECAPWFGCRQCYLIRAEIP